LVVDPTHGPQTRLDVLKRFQPAAVWFSDDDYELLASMAAHARFTSESIRDVFTSDEVSDGAEAFARVFDARMVSLFAPATRLPDSAIAAHDPRHSSTAEREGVHGHEPTVTALAAPVRAKRDPSGAKEEEQREKERQREVRRRAEEEGKA